jgi:hypothetical protein
LVIVPSVEQGLAIIDSVYSENSKRQAAFTAAANCAKASAGSGTGGGGAAGVGYGGYETIASVSATERNNTKLKEMKRDENIKFALECIGAGLATQTDDIMDIAGKLKKSVTLRNILSELLRNDSVLDISSRAPLYHELLTFVGALASEVFTAAYLFDVPSETDFQSSSLSDLMGRLADKARVYLALQQNIASEVTNLAEQDALGMSAHIREAYERLMRGRSMALQVGVFVHAPPATPSARSASGSPLSWRQEECKAYVDSLAPKRFEAISLCEMISDSVASHAFYPANSTVGKSGHHNPNPVASVHYGVGRDSRARLTHIVKEMSDLSSSLPVEYASSIFVRCDDERMDVIKALIIGPEDTPYENGCFIFDILLPADYPQSPPQVNLTTTGG